MSILNDDLIEKSDKYSKQHKSFSLYSPHPQWFESQHYLATIYKDLNDCVYLSLWF